MPPFSFRYFKALSKVVHVSGLSLSAYSPLSLLQLTGRLLYLPLSAFHHVFTTTQFGRAFISSGMAARNAFSFSSKEVFTCSLGRLYSAPYASFPLTSSPKAFAVSSAVFFSSPLLSLKRTVKSLCKLNLIVPFSVLSFIHLLGI